MPSRYQRNKPDDGAEWEDRPNGGEAGPRPHRAVRLVDAMAGKPATSAGKPATPANRPAIPAGISAIRAGETATSAEEPKMSPRREEEPEGRTADRVSRVRQSAAPQQAPVSPEATVSPNVFAVLSVHPEGVGETVAVVLSVPAEEAQRLVSGTETARRDGTDGEPTKVKLHLLPEQYAELGVRMGEITAERADELMEAGKLCKAVRRGMALLEYGDQSVRKLAYKLTAKGVDRVTADRAAAYLAERGYIREDNTATLRAEQGHRKGWGPRRIREDLRAQGFTADAVDEAMESLAEVDWTESCAAAIRKKYGEVPTDRARRQKLIAALMRLGYDADTVREAMRMLLRGE